MWDNPRLMNLIANCLFVLVAAATAAVGVYELARSPAFPLKAIRIEGELTRVARADIVNALQSRVQGTFFTSNLEVVRKQFESVPWVRRAVVRRQWPDRLEVRLEEHVELARWGRREDGTLVNIYGELFSASTTSDLPLFSGPQGSAKGVAESYAEFARLLAPLAVVPRQIVLSERHAWQLKLDSGLVIQLGRDLPKDTVKERLARFVDAYPRALAPMKRRLDYVDLRYPNGFVLRVPGLQRAEDAKPGNNAPRAKV
ncbi:MAG: cell division protein FtsQ/DivIB [Burkholderiales bacterium]